MMEGNSTNATEHYVPPVERNVMEKVGLGIPLMLMSIFGSLGNIIVLYAFVYMKKLLNNPSNIFILSLAVSNFLTSFFVMPVHLLELVFPQFFSDSGWSCDVAAVLSYPFFIVNNFTLVALSADRFIAVSRPTRYKVQVTPRRAARVALIIWSYVLLLTTILRIFIVPRFSVSSMDCGLNWLARGFLFMAFAFTVNLFIPLVSIIVLNVLIWKRVRRRSQLFEKSWGLRKPSAATPKKESRKTELERRVVIMVTCIIVTCIVCWIPYFVTRLLGLVHVAQPVWAYSVAVWFLHLSSPVNPLIYTAFKRDFLDVFLRILPCFENRIEQELETTF